MADYYADSVNGSDANTGTSEALAFKTLAALRTAALAYGNGVSLSLARGSFWRESLDISSLTGVTIDVHGGGNAPIIDGADIINGWSKTALLTNVYEKSVTHDGTGSDRLTVYEDGTLLLRVDDQATCDSTAGSFVDVQGSDGTPVTIYIHPTGSTVPGSDGKLYEVSVRTVVASFGISANVAGAIHARRAIAGGGAIHAETDVTLSKLLATWGTKHNIRFGSGTVRDCIAAYNDPPTSYEPSNTLWVGYEDDVTGESILLERCGTIGRSGISNGADWTAHDAGSGVYTSIIHRQCWVVNVFTISGPAANGIESISEGCYGIEVGNMPLAKVVRYYQGRNVTYITMLAAASTLQDSAIYIEERYAAGNFDEVLRLTAWPITIQRCAFTGPTQNTNLMANTSGTGTLTFQNNIADGGALHIDLAAGTTYVGDYNVFRVTNIFDATTRFLGRIGATYYSTLADWQAATSQDANSVYLDPADQVAGSANAFWLSVSENRGDPETYGDFRINPAARVYGADGTAYVGTFADGVTAITEAGPQTHWHWGNRATADGPPTAWPDVPETLDEAQLWMKGTDGVELPTESQVLDGVGYGYGGSEYSGNVVLPPANRVLTGETYGANSGTTGTLVSPSAADTANAVWAAQTADNVTTGSFGAWVKNSLAPLSSLNTLSNKIGSFSGSGVETVKGAFIALMRSDGTALSAIGGTYDPATDSLQATADRTISIAAKTELISSGSVTITSPVAADGTTITVVQGDDYSNDDGRAITWTGTAADQWPDLTGATLEFTARMKGAADITAVPTVVTPTGTQVFRMELSSTDTDVTTGRYRYDVQATLDGGNVATLLNGAFVVQRTYTDAP